MLSGCPKGIMRLSSANAVYIRWLFITFSIYNYQSTETSDSDLLAPISNSLLGHKLQCCMKITFVIYLNLTVLERKYKNKNAITSKAGSTAIIRSVSEPANNLACVSIRNSFVPCIEFKISETV